MSTLDDRSPIHLSRPSQKEIDAHIAQAHRLRSQAFGTVFRAFTRALVKPFGGQRQRRRVNPSGALHPT